MKASPGSKSPLIVTDALERPRSTPGWHPRTDFVTVGRDEDSVGDGADDGFRTA
jgi:hypothetical protein